jgi:hypothetical protein
MLEQYHAGQETGTGQASARPKNPAPRRGVSAPSPDRTAADRRHKLCAGVVSDGFGLISHHEAGDDALVALAHETGQRLEAVKEIWNEALGERRRSRGLKRGRAS